ncbi:hypothetical protein [Nonomuraea jabiensis]|uniref:Uncharacterized protein n=1 Tax=Nonomuraea jabiensis TaxID=882448 RepID=A0A7W9LEA2_9ACTN|nr:hypothetical protein [Nonomuraea jabiensis]MBB5780626.1 hypothetical protein [Nonomuraea jabiensis]
MPPPPSAARRTWGRVRLVLAVVVSACALAGAVRLTVPATAGTSGEPPGVRRQLAFLAWAKTARPWVSRPPPAPPATVSWWRTPLLVLLTALAAAPWLPALRRSWSASFGRERVAPEGP